MGSVTLLMVFVIVKPCMNSFNQGIQPQVFKKGTTIGQVEQVSLVEHNDPIWNYIWEEPIIGHFI